MNLKNRLSFFLKDKLVLHTAIVFLGTSIASFFNLLYHLVSVRLLIPEDYGTLNALISFVTFIFMAISPLGTTLTRFFSEYVTRRDFVVLSGVFKEITKRLIIAGLVIVPLFIIISPALAGFLKTKTCYVMICGGIIAFSLFPLSFLSLFQSFQKFKVYSLIGIISSFGKLIAGAFLMFLGWGIIGGMSGFLFSAVLAFFIPVFFIADIFRKEMAHINKEAGVAADLTPIYKYFLPVSIAMFSFALLTSADVILVKHFFSPIDAGYYSIAQMAGKIALFLPSAAVVVILPAAVEAHITQGSSLRLLYKALFMAGVCGLIFTTCSFLFPGLLLKVLAGKVNPASKELVGLFSLAMSCYALVWIIINFSLAVNNLKFVGPLLFITVLEVGTVYACHASLIRVINIILVFSVVTLIALFLVVRITYRQKP